MTDTADGGVLALHRGPTFWHLSAADVEAELQSGAEQVEAVVAKFKETIASKFATSV